MSVGQIFDDGFAVHFDANHVYLQKVRLLLIGNRYPSTGLYHIDFDTPTHPPQIDNPAALSLASIMATSESMANLVRHMTTKSELVQYLHQVAWIPIPSTYIRAIELGYYAPWPGLAAELVSRLLPKSIHTEKGKLRQERKNFRSAK